MKIVGCQNTNGQEESNNDIFGQIVSVQFFHVISSEHLFHFWQVQSGSHPLSVESQAGRVLLVVIYCQESDFFVSLCLIRGRLMAWGYQHLPECRAADEWIRLDRVGKIHFLIVFWPVTSPAHLTNDTLITRILLFYGICFLVICQIVVQRSLLTVK